MGIEKTFEAHCGNNAGYIVFKKFVEIDVIEKTGYLSLYAYKDSGSFVSGKKEMCKTFITLSDNTNLAGDGAFQTIDIDSVYPKTDATIEQFLQTGKVKFGNILVDLSV